MSPEFASTNTPQQMDILKRMGKSSGVWFGACLPTEDWQASSGIINVHSAVSEQKSAILRDWHEVPVQDAMPTRARLVFF